jgi:hypothetical protein
MAFAAVGQAYQENRANAKGKGLREGFARGLAAPLVFSGSKARHLARVELAPRFVDASVEKQVAGVAGAEEKGIVLGLKAGIDFGDRISSEQRQNFLHAALQDLATEGHHWTTEDRKTPANTWYTSENEWNITKALRPTVTKMLDQQEAVQQLLHSLQLQYDVAEQTKAAGADTPHTAPPPSSGT